MFSDGNSLTLKLLSSTNAPYTLDPIASRDHISAAPFTAVIYYTNTLLKWVKHSNCCVSEVEVKSIIKLR